ncbi:MAG: metalloregulator ArsR/SmtB family transcription factor [Rhodospirillales bacterium]|jgi:ubiquinone/menaquinone biosynthesis C-methylase UbiE/DNA-binding transcriptional ArsR family regulator|nr:metalloregulator ArsR/SmtB family transcription factor [Rhodospirillales bacterium]
MDSLLDALKAISEATRLRILALCRTGELSVNELCEILGQSQPRISRHLKLLVDAGVLEKIPEGNSVFHRLSQSMTGGQIARQIVTLLPESDELLLEDQERLAKTKDIRAKNAAQYFKENATQWNKLRALHVDEADVESLVTSLIPPKQAGELLDIGTGTGRMLEIYGPHTLKSEGIDLSRHMLAIARSNLDKAAIQNCRVRQGDMYNLPYKRQSIDTILFHQVLHFADDPSRAVEEASRALRPGGKILIVDFAPHKVESLRSEHAHRRLGFPEKEIKGWLEAAGLKIVSIQHLAGDPLTVSFWLAESP